MAPRSHPAELVSLVLYEDPLSPWCLVAERRIRAALDEVAAMYRPLRLAPFPIRPVPSAPSARERRALAREARRAAKEPEAAHTRPDLWLSADVPLSTFLPLAALDAARVQGSSRETALRDAIRDAGLVCGINVTRSDVLYELAEGAGLDVARFVAALRAPATERRVRCAFEEAVDKGIDGAPTLVIGDEWLVAGARSGDEYRAILRRYASSRLGVPHARTFH